MHFHKIKIRIHGKNATLTSTDGKVRQQYFAGEHSLLNYTHTFYPILILTNL